MLSLHIEATQHHGFDDLRLLHSQAQSLRMVDQYGVMRIKGNGRKQQVVRGPQGSIGVRR